ncbi:hypothetical protein APUTEX25_003300, partial [Auxenochlorella protothecoides]
AQFPMRRVFRGVWILLTLCTFSALPWMIVELRKQHFSVHYQGWFIAGVFVILAVSASIYEVAMHLEHYNRPALQIRVVRILWMVPIYAVDAWLSLRFSDARTYIDPLRECYEAFVIYNFYCYLMAYLEEEYGDVDAYYATRPPVPHPAPMDRLLRPWAPGADFFWETKRGVLAYVITRPLTTADYMDPNSQRPGFLKNVKVMFDVRDVVDDVQGVVTDTGDNIADMGRRTWKQAKNHTANLVQSPPSYLKGLFARDAKLRRKEGEGVPYSDEDSSPTRGSLHALLQRSQSRPGPISSSP